MGRLIDADVVIKHIEEYWEMVKRGKPSRGMTTVMQNIKTIVNSLPTVDAEPVRHGKWIIWDEIIAGIYHTVSECSECGFTTDKMSREEMPYCPNCGARMDDGNRNE